MSIYPTLVPLTEFPFRHTGFTEQQLRWLFWRSQPVKRTVRGGQSERLVEELEPNGYAEAFLKIGGRVYIDEDRFFEIVAEQNGRATV